MHCIERCLRAKPTLWCRALWKHWSWFRHRHVVAWRMVHRCCYRRHRCDSALSHLELECWVAEREFHSKFGFPIFINWCFLIASNTHLIHFMEIPIGKLWSFQKFIQLNDFLWETSRYELLSLLDELVLVLLNLLSWMWWTFKENTKLKSALARFMNFLCATQSCSNMPRLDSLCRRQTTNRTMTEHNLTTIAIQYCVLDAVIELSMTFWGFDAVKIEQGNVERVRIAYFGKSIQTQICLAASSNRHQIESKFDSLSHLAPCSVAGACRWQQFSRLWHSLLVWFSQNFRYLFICVCHCSSIRFVFFPAGQFYFDNG